MMSREEEMLSAIVNGETIEKKCICRREQFLSAIANNEGASNLPDPICREEYYYKRIAEKGLDRPDQSKTVTPTTSQQIITPDTGYELGSVIINPVSNVVDSNIQPSNIKAGVTILGVEGNIVPDKPDQTKTVIPTTAQQIVTPDTGYELASVVVEAMAGTVQKCKVQQIITGENTCQLIITDSGDGEELLVSGFADGDYNKLYMAIE